MSGVVLAHYTSKPSGWIDYLPIIVVAAMIIGIVIWLVPSRDERLRPPPKRRFHAHHVGPDSAETRNTSMMKSAGYPTISSGLKK